MDTLLPASARTNLIRSSPDALVATELKVISVLDYFKQMNVVSVVNHVRVNANGYPYVTLMDNANVAHNTYLSKGASANVVAGEVVNKEFLAKFSIGFATNAAGEERIKFVRADAGNRVSINDLF